MLNLFPKALVLGVIIVLSAAGSATSQQVSASARPPAASTVSLTGCISATPGPSGQFGFVDAGTASMYRLTGNDVRKFAGQRTQLVVGSSTNAVTIRGGLWPSPNIAAQAGALDSAQAAIARSEQTNVAASSGAVTELRVVGVRGLTGTCR
jgi:hypothetical protein